MSNWLYRGLRYNRAKRFWRKLAPIFVVIFAWSSTLATAAQAYAVNSALSTQQSELTTPHSRPLTPAEKRSIRGAQGSGSGISYDSGGAYAWEGKAGDVTTCNGNREFTLPIVGWTAKGGMPVNFTLYHSSKSAYNRELGQKWSCNYIIYFFLDISNGNVSVHWGDDLGYTFTKNMDGSFTPPTGIHDTLTSLSPSGYQIVTKDQITYKFTVSSDGKRFNCSTIKDLRANTITLNYNGGSMGSPYWLASIVDPTSRTISISYTSNKISSITDPLSRVWSLTYNGSTELTQVTFPTVGGSSYNCQFAYNTNHNITTYTDKRAKTWTAQYGSDNTVTWEKDPYNNQTQYS